MGGFMGGHDNIFYSFWGPPFRPENPVGQWYKANVHGFDYCIILNGILEAGYSLDGPEFHLSEYESQWYPEVKPEVEKIENEQAEKYKIEYGRYITCHFSGGPGYGQFYYNVANHKQIYDFLMQAKEASKADKIVLVGVSWDTDAVNGIASYDKTGSIINKLNNTTISELFSLYKGSIGSIGTHSGASMVPVWNRKPALVFFPIRETYDRWNKSFIKNHLPPDSFEVTHFPRYIQQIHENPKGLLDLISEKFV
jgi:hypothetical protein